MSIPGNFVLPRFTNIPPVDNTQIKNVLSYEIKQYVPFDTKSIIWDFHQMSERMPGAESLEIGVFVAKRATLENILMFINVAAIKFKLTTMQVSPLAVYNFVSFDRQVEYPAIIINVEEENTDLVFVNGPHFWIRSVPLFKVDADFVKELRKSIEYYVSLSKSNVQLKTILLMGHSFKDAQNVRFIADNIKCEVKVLEALNNIKLSDRINKVYFNEHFIDFGVALGLAIQGVNVGRVKTNLLPQELIKAGMLARKKPYAIAALGCLAAAFIIQYCGLFMQMGYLGNVNGYGQKTLQCLKGLEREYKNANALTQTSNAALNLISSIDSSRFFWFEMLDKLLSIIPDSVSLNNIQSSWIDANTLKGDVSDKKTSQGFFQAKKLDVPAKGGTQKKRLLIEIYGESRGHGMAFIEEHILKPIQNLTLFDQKVSAFKDVEIVPGSCHQVDSENGKERHISFEIRWLVKSEDEIRAETKL